MTSISNSYSSSEVDSESSSKYISSSENNSGPKKDSIPNFEENNENLFSKTDSIPNSEENNRKFKSIVEKEKQKKIKRKNISFLESKSKSNTKFIMKNTPDTERIHNEVESLIKKIEKKHKNKKKKKSWLWIL